MNYTPQKARVLLVEHSHLFCLKAFMVSQDDACFSHFAVSEAGDINFSAVRVTRFQSERSTDAMERIAPEIIILCLGGNDIDATDAHTLRVGMDTFHLASKLKYNIHDLRRVGFC